MSNRLIFYGVAIMVVGAAVFYFLQGSTENQPEVIKIPEIQPNRTSQPSEESPQKALPEKEQASSTQSNFAGDAQVIQGENMPQFAGSIEVLAGGVASAGPVVVR